MKNPDLNRPAQQAPTPPARYPELPWVGPTPRSRALPAMREVCRSCLVRPERSTLAAEYGPEGVWAGLVPRERRRGRPGP